MGDWTLRSGDEAQGSLEVAGKALAMGVFFFNNYIQILHRIKKTSEENRG